MDIELRFSFGTRSGTFSAQFYYEESQNEISSSESYQEMLMPGVVIKDKLGNDICVEDRLNTHGPNNRTLAQVLKGDPTYLVVESDKTLATYGIKLSARILVVPYRGTLPRTSSSALATDPSATRARLSMGLAPLSVALVHADIDDGKVVFVPLVETDFRTGQNPW
ncbi:cytochrome b6-f complex iron-sulfur subunit, chloroplastic-like [Lolium perenne]|uniref:cytochrome b6-f complex iron-sulfur subunit, chloroplastic-like n=1 Tax=Lolium perenne TaxID=4522 RepID=UPI0021F5D62A|nr:cytochrome b6-f complex iron-sulfur subunit, chloroplastic-like [Lolium perenne]